MAARAIQRAEEDRSGLRSLPISRTQSEVTGDSETASELYARFQDVRQELLDDHSSLHPSTENISVQNAKLLEDGYRLIKEDNEADEETAEIFRGRASTSGSQKYSNDLVTGGYVSRGQCDAANTIERGKIKNLKNQLGDNLSTLTGRSLTPDPIRARANSSTSGLTSPALTSKEVSPAPEATKEVQEEAEELAREIEAAAASATKDSTPSPTASFKRRKLEHMKGKIKVVDIDFGELERARSVKGPRSVDAIEKDIQTKRSSKQYSEAETVDYQSLLRRNPQSPNTSVHNKSAEHHDPGEDYRKSLKPVRQSSSKNKFDFNSSSVDKHRGETAAASSSVEGSSSFEKVTVQKSGRIKASHQQQHHSLQELSPPLTPMDGVEEKPHNAHLESELQNAMKSLKSSRTEQASTKAQVDDVDIGIDTSSAGGVKGIRNMFEKQGFNPFAGRQQAQNKPKQPKTYKFEVKTDQEDTVALAPSTLKPGEIPPPPPPYDAPAPPPPENWQHQRHQDNPLSRSSSKSTTRSSIAPAPAPATIVTAASPPRNAPTVFRGESQREDKREKRTETEFVSIEQATLEMPNRYRSGSPGSEHSEMGATYDFADDRSEAPSMYVTSSQTAVYATIDKTDLIEHTDSVERTDLVDRTDSVKRNDSVERTDSVKRTDSQRSRQTPEQEAPKLSLYQKNPQASYGRSHVQKLAKKEIDINSPDVAAKVENLLGAKVKPGEGVRSLRLAYRERGTILDAPQPKIDPHGPGTVFVDTESYQDPLMTYDVPKLNLQSEGRQYQGKDDMVSSHKAYKQQQVKEYQEEQRQSYQEKQMREVLDGGEVLDGREVLDGEDVLPDDDLAGPRSSSTDESPTRGGAPISDAGYSSYTGSMNRMYAKAQRDLKMSKPIAGIREVPSLITAEATPVDGLEEYLDDDMDQDTYQRRYVKHSNSMAKPGAAPVRYRMKRRPNGFNGHGTISSSDRLMSASMDSLNSDMSDQMSAVSEPIFMDDGSRVIVSRVQGRRHRQQHRASRSMSASRGPRGSNVSVVSVGSPVRSTNSSLDRQSYTTQSQSQSRRIISKEEEWYFRDRPNHRDLSSDRSVVYTDGRRKRSDSTTEILLHGDGIQSYQDEYYSHQESEAPREKHRDTEVILTKPAWERHTHVTRETIQQEKRRLASHDTTERRRHQRLTSPVHRSVSQRSYSSSGHGGGRNHQYTSVTSPKSVQPRMGTGTLSTSMQTLPNAATSGQHYSTSSMPKYRAVSSVNVGQQQQQQYSTVAAGQRHHVRSQTQQPQQVTTTQKQPRGGGGVMVRVGGGAPQAATHQRSMTTSSQGTNRQQLSSTSSQQSAQSFSQQSQLGNGWVTARRAPPPASSGQRGHDVNRGHEMASNRQHQTSSSSSSAVVAARQNGQQQQQGGTRQHQAISQTIRETSATAGGITTQHTATDVREVRNGVSTAYSESRTTHNPATSLSPATSQSVLQQMANVQPDQPLRLYDAVAY